MSGPEPAIAPAATLYPSYVRKNLGPLAPFLLTRSSDMEIDERGCFGSDGIDQVEALLLDQARQCLVGFELPPDLMPGRRLEDRWRLASAAEVDQGLRCNHVVRRRQRAL